MVLKIKILNIIGMVGSLLALLVFSIPNASSQNQKGWANVIKIGLLIPDNTSVEARLGAEMAISKANENGGINGRLFQLVTRSMEGLWGTGSKKAVGLIFKEKVWAILGSHNGQNAHLVEQVIAKTGIVFLSAWASDPTLSQAFVPWYFSCVPNDNQQATTFIKEICEKRRITKIATVSDKGYDSKLALNSFLIKSKAESNPEILSFFYDASCQNFNTIADQIAKADANALVVFGKPSPSLKIIQQMRQQKMNLPVFGALSLLGESKFTDLELKDYEGVTLINSGNWLNINGLEFRKEFQKKYDKIPGAVAAYAFDGMNILLETIRKTGLDREKIKKTMSYIYYEGITGAIQFDDKGNRMGTVGLMEIKNGIPVAIEK